MEHISEKEVLKKLYFDNPWWQTGQVEKRFRDFPHRFYFSSFFALVQTRSINRAVVLMGPRRVGKTVMVYHAIHDLLSQGIEPKHILYASLDTPLYSGLALEKIVNIFQEEFQHDRNTDVYIVFDEIQYLKKWEVHLKSLVDSYPAYKFIATGSAAAALKFKSQESGAGRFTDFLLPPLTFAEYISFIGKKELVFSSGGLAEFPQTHDIEALNLEFVNYLNYGGYPEAVFSEEIQRDSARYIQSDIIDKVLLRDLPSIYGIDDVQELYQLFNVIAYNTGNEISLESLSKSSHVAKNTIKKYIEYLEAAFLIKIVHRVDLNAKKFKRATSFKVYLTNPSMRTALFGIIEEKDEAMGRMVETAIYSQWFHDQSGYGGLYYARWKNGEVDLVYLDQVGQSPDWCVEIKWSDLPAKDIKKLKSLVTFSTENNLSDVIVTTKTVTQVGHIDDIKLRYVPSALYAYTVGENNFIEVHSDSKT